jgi:hypothetical protein
MMAKSTATPWLDAQPNLAGWVGEQASFDPLGISNLVDMAFVREAEIKVCCRAPPIPCFALNPAFFWCLR